MKLLIPIIGFGPTGGFRVLSRLATEWHRAGHEVTMVSPLGTAAPYHPTEADIRWAPLMGPLAGSNAEAGAVRRWQGARNIISVWNGTRRLAKDHDVVLANHSLTALPIYLAGTANRARFYYIQADEAEYYRDLHAPMKQALARMSYALPFRQIVNAPVYFDNPAFDTDVFVPPGVDLANYAPRRHRDFADGAPIFLGCIGRHEEAKGTRYVLEAFAALHAADPRYRLRIAYGNLPSGWHHDAAEVIVPRNDIELADFYRSVDIMVAPGTIQHGAPHYPVMEAMACAIPVVTTGYMPATADNCWLVANRDAGAIVEACRAIVADTAYGGRVALASNAMQAFDWPAVANKMLAIFAATAGRQ